MSTCVHVRVADATTWGVTLRLFLCGPTDEDNVQKKVDLLNQNWVPKANKALNPNNFVVDVIYHKKEHRNDKGHKIGETQYCNIRVLHDDSGLGPMFPLDPLN